LSGKSSPWVRHFLQATQAAHEFLARYHRERNHQGLANRLISPEAGQSGKAGGVQRRQRLGGMLNYYYRAAA
jgi:hypothetical protein